MSITQLLGIKYPIFQGGMAQIAVSPLVGAVSNAGGLGIIGSGGFTADRLRDEIRKAKASTDKPFAVNLMLMMNNIPELIQVIIEEGVKIVTTGAGTPAPYMPILKEHGIIVIPVVPSVKIAKKMEALGVDAIVAEGTEAGGHVGETTTMALLPQVASAVSIPVIGAAWNCRWTRDCRCFCPRSTGCSGGNPVPRDCGMPDTRELQAGGYQRR